MGGGGRDFVVVVNDSLETFLLGLRTHTRVALHELAEAKIQFCKGTENKRKEEISTMAMSGHISSLICYETILFHG